MGPISIGIYNLFVASAESSILTSAANFYAQTMPALLKAAGVSADSFSGDAAMACAKLLAQTPSGFLGGLRFKPNLFDVPGFFPFDFAQGQNDSMLFTHTETGGYRMGGERGGASSGKTVKPPATVRIDSRFAKQLIQFLYEGRPQPENEKEAEETRHLKEAIEKRKLTAAQVGVLRLACAHCYDYPVLYSSLFSRDLIRVFEVPKEKTDPSGVEEPLSLLFSPYTLDFWGEQGKREKIADHFEKNMNRFIKEGSFTQWDFEKILHSLFTWDQNWVRETLRFVRACFPAFVEAGWVNDWHIRYLADSLLEKNSNEVLGGLLFFDRHLPLLMEKGWFSEIYLMWIVKHSVDEAGCRRFIQQILMRYLPSFAKEGLLSSRVVASLALNYSDLFFHYFHLFKADGSLSSELLKTLLQECGFYEGEEAYAVLKLVGDDPEWLGSPRRWRQLVNLLQTKGPLVHLIFNTLREHPGIVTAQESASLLSLLDGMTEEETRTLGGRGMEGAERMGILLQEAALRLGVNEHPHYLAMQEKISTEGGDHFLAEWSLTGMERVWRGYVEASPEDKKKVRKLFLNFLKQNTSRHPPSYARLFIKEGEQIIEENFIRRLDLQEMAEQKIWNRFVTSRLYRLFVAASRFMEPKGIDSLRRLVLGLGVGGDGRLTYPRYAELEGVFSENFLSKWRQEYLSTPDSLGTLSAEAGKRALKQQTLSQMAMHLRPDTPEEGEIPEVLRDLPERVGRWLASYEASAKLDGVFLGEAEELWRLFEVHYADVRGVFGDFFANIRIDLRNYIHGMAKGLQVAKEGETFSVTGDIENLARIGAEPVETCQNMESKWEGVNEDGEPVHRLLHGQIKVARWMIDNAVGARRLLEITKDAEGREHLLVEMLYVAGGFGRVEEFKDAILKYAVFLGIPPTPDRVHFNDEPSLLTAPKVLPTPDVLQRDTFPP